MTSDDRWVSPIFRYRIKSRLCSTNESSLWGCIWPGCGRIARSDVRRRKELLSIGRISRIERSLRDRPVDVVDMGVRNGAIKMLWRLKVLWRMMIWLLWEAAKIVGKRRMRLRLTRLRKLVPILGRWWRARLSRMVGNVLTASTARLIV